ncbi:hypothetical protein [uncultured Rubinisphaera sp.]|uniref:hypothetical protein n=1 Tax=uncultured Rubinisphaera sp. TaxID=1678686 RepID=UPI0030D6E9AF
MKRILHISAVCCCGLAMAFLGTPVEAQRGGKAPSGQKSAQGNRGSSNNGGAQRGSSNRGSSDRGSSNRGSSERGSSNRGSSQRGSSNQGSSERSGQPPRGSGERTQGSRNPSSENSNRGDNSNQGQENRGSDRSDRGNRPEGDRSNPTQDQNRGSERPEMNRSDRAEEFREKMQRFNQNRGEGERGENNRGDENRPGDGNRPTEQGEDRAQNNRPNPRGTDYLRNYLSGQRNQGDRDQNNRADNPEDRLRNRIEGALDPRNQNRNTAENNLRDRLNNQENNLERYQNQQFRRWDNADQTAARIRNNFVQNRNQNRNQNLRFDQNYWRSLIGNNNGNNRVNGYFHVYGSLNGNRNYARNYWWQPTPANSLTRWLRGSYNSPRYYSYGPGGDIYCRNGYVYVSGDRYATIPEYYNQAVHVVRSVPEMTPEQAEEMEWKPLGVFALASDENQEASFIVQLAINQDGILSGTFYDEKSQETRPLLGRVDEGSQRAVWHFADDPQNGIVMETMLFNLSRDETSVLVHFGEETTESWLMVRIPEPEEN